MRILIEPTDNVQREAVICVDASTLGFPPGKWPNELEVGKNTITVWQRVGAFYSNGAIYFMIYTAPNGDIMKVFND